VTLAVLAMAGLSSTAVAQSWTRPPMVDHDSASEDYSEFWEQVLAGSDGDYERLMKRAEDLRSSRSPEQWKQALPLLQEAAALRPDRPEAHRAIGRQHFQTRDWARCSASLSRVVDLQAKSGESETERPGELLVQLGTCLLYSGHYEGALDHLGHVITQRLEPDTEKMSLVEMRLGEAFMALGRLEEATFAFTRATALAKNHRHMLKQAEYGLAVALDRAERLEESRTLLTRLVRGDSQLTTLRSTDKSYAPANDEHYYLALAYEAQHNQIRALYHFRRFATLAQLGPPSPWTTHALNHATSLGTPALAAQLDVTGSAQWPVDELRKAIRKSAGPLQRCAKGYPEVLATITLTSALTKPAAQLQARAVIDVQTELERETLTGVVECLESAARKIRMPRQSGLVGGHGTAVFSLIGAPSDQNP
jgi:tetratricopeptide (TPR) repeat protein